VPARCDAQAISGERSARVFQPLDEFEPTELEVVPACSYAVTR